MRRSRLQRLFGVISGGVFGLILLFLYAPLAILILLSFQTRTTAVFPPKELTTVSYEKLLNPNDFTLFTIPGEPLVDYWPALTLSLTLAVTAAVIATVLALSAALAFRDGFRGRNSLFYFLLLGMLAPGVILGLGLRLFASEIGLEPSPWTTGLLVHVAWTMPFGFIVFLIFLNRMDRSVEEAAAVLGASRWKVFRTVTLPLLTPGVMGSLLFGFTLSLDEVGRSSLVMGLRNTLPLELLAATGVRITPVVYALGSIIAVTSFAFLLVYVLAFERQRRKVAVALPPEDSESPQVPPTPADPPADAQPIAA